MAFYCSVLYYFVLDCIVIDPYLGMDPAEFREQKESLKPTLFLGMDNAAAQLNVKLEGKVKCKQCGFLLGDVSGIKCYLEIGRASCRERV